MGIPIDTLIDPILIKDGEELSYSTWKIDWAKSELEIKNADDKATYCLIIYMNKNLFSEEYIEKADDERVDKPRI
jgi:histidinol phosphatase-like enzyme